MMTREDIAKRFEFIKQAVYQAGQLASSMRTNELQVQTKGVMDFVTNADLQVEEKLVEMITKAFPQDSIFAEEQAKGGADSEAQKHGVWVIDPIDGTTNYAIGSSLWAVSIAWMLDGETVLGAIYAADRNEVFSAWAGQGAFLNGRILHGDSVMGGGENQPADLLPVYHGWSARTDFASYIDLLKGLNQIGLHDRKIGSAALSLVHVARGDAGAFYEAHLNSWDCLAGLLICREAGCEADVSGISLVDGGAGVVMRNPVMPQLQQLFHQAQIQSN